MKKQKLEIDYETGDRITVLVLKEQLEYFKEDIKKITKEAKKGELPNYRAEELGKNIQLVENFKQVLNYFGEPAE